MHSTLTTDLPARPATEDVHPSPASAPTWDLPRNAAGAFIEARDLTRVWGRGDGAQTAVDRVSLDLYPGEIVSIVGPSGSGKSTLGALLAGIDRPTSGSIVAAGKRLDGLKDDALARWRASNVGIVFQDFHLLPTLTARENVELALKLKGQRRRRKSAALAALASVGLESRADRLPSQMSGGEQQRVGIARALSVKPNLLVADEPTGSLDQASGQNVFDLLLDAGSTGTTVVFITHDMDLGAAASRVIHMTDGRVADVRWGQGR